MEIAKDKNSSRSVIVFMTALCFVAALILSLLSSLLAPYQIKEVKLYQSKELLIAAKILKSDGRHFQDDSLATDAEIFKVQKERIIPKLIDKNGNVFTFGELHIDYENYLKENQKKGFATLPYKLIYFILPNEGYIIPINGYGLWDAIYGYLALEKDGNTVIGTTWYNQKETPGLGANIAERQWQANFDNKQIFELSPNGTLNIKTAKLGITVVKTSVKDEMGSSPSAKSAVDGIAGATVTRNGVQEAYRQCLAPYRPFLVKVYEAEHK